MKRATPHRVGRVVGQLDDLQTLAAAYAEGEAAETIPDTELVARLRELAARLEESFALAEEVVGLLDHHRGRPQ